MAAPALPAGFDTYITSTRDTSSNWSLASSLNNASLASIFGQASNGDLLTIHYDEGDASHVVYYSTDKGASWSRCATNLGTVRVATNNPTVTIDHVNDLIFMCAGDNGGELTVWVASYNTSTNDVTLEDEFFADTATNAQAITPIYLQYDSGNSDIVRLIFLGSDDTTERLYTLQYTISTSTLGSSNKFGVAQNYFGRNGNYFGSNGFPSPESADTAPWIIPEANPELWAGNNTSGTSFGFTPLTVGTTYYDTEGTPYSSSVTGLGTDGGQLHYRPNTDSWVYISANLRSSTNLDLHIMTNDNSEPDAGTWTLVYDMFDDDSTALVINTSGTYEYNYFIWYEPYNDVVYLIGADWTQDDLVFWKYDIVADTMTETNLGDVSGSAWTQPPLMGFYVSHQGSEWVVGAYGWVIGTVSSENYPAWATVDTPTINTAPVATITEPAETGVNANSEEPLELKWSYSDADGDTQTKWQLRRIVDAVTTRYWDGDSWESTTTELAGATLSITLDGGWGDPSTETVHSYSVKVFDGTSWSEWSDAVAIFPTSSVSTSRGFALPRPYKKQENLVKTLKSNNDYMLSWVNNYVPAYGDLNDDLYLRAGLRTGGPSQLRNTFPPVVGEFDIGNGTSYFNAMGATNIYRTNEFSLSSEKEKNFLALGEFPALDIIDALPVEKFQFKDKKRNSAGNYRYGIVAEDLADVLKEASISVRDSSFLHESDGLLHVNNDQLIPLLWEAIQELKAQVEALQTPRSVSKGTFKRRKSRSNKNT